MDGRDCCVLQKEEPEKTTDDQTRQTGQVPTLQCLSLYRCVKTEDWRLKTRKRETWGCLTITLFILISWVLLVDPYGRSFVSDCCSYQSFYKNNIIDLLNKCEWMIKCNQNYYLHCNYRRPLWSDHSIFFELNSAGSILWHYNSSSRVTINFLRHLSSSVTTSHNIDIVSVFKSLFKSVFSKVLSHISLTPMVILCLHLFLLSSTNHRNEITITI